MKIIVAQIGARHHYAIPRMLQQQSCLEALYTDSCANRGIGRLLSVIIPPVLRRGRLGKLLDRKIEGVGKERIHSTDRLLFDQLLAPKGDDSSPRIERAGELFSDEM